MKLAQLISANPRDIVKIREDSTIAAAADTITAEKIGAILVEDSSGAIVGILSERDIVRELGKRGAGCMSDKVDDLMTSKLVTCAPDEPTDKVLQTMTDKRFRHMPVMEGDVMVGLITLGDVVKARLSELSMEKDALESMIMGH